MVAKHIVFRVLAVDQSGVRSGVAEDCQVLTCSCLASGPLRLTGECYCTLVTGLWRRSFQATAAPLWTFHGRSIKTTTVRINTRKYLTCQIGSIARVPMVARRSLRSQKATAHP
jgi:hypothetical protein